MCGGGFICGLGENKVREMQKLRKGRLRKEDLGDERDLLQKKFRSKVVQGLRGYIKHLYAQGSLSFSSNPP